MTRQEPLPHVHIRALEPEDLELLYQIENDINVWQVGVTNVPYSRFILQDFITRSTGDIYTDKQVRLMVENEQGVTVGIVDIIDFDPRHLKAEVGIIIRPTYRRQGYAQATLSNLKDYCKKVLRLHQLYAIIADTNNVSRHLFQSVGFEATASLKDWLYEEGKYTSATVMQSFL